MSRADNVEVVRRSFDAFETADMDAWTADWTEDIEFDVSGYGPWTDPRKTYSGPVEILEFFGRMMSGVRVLTIVYTLRDGRFARVQVHSDFAAARRTAAAAAPG